MGLGQIMGGILSWAFQFVKPTAPLAGWRIMFLVLGLVTLLLGGLIWLLVPDNPMSAQFLSPQEKVVLLEHVKVNQTGIENRNFQPKQILEALLNFPVWAFFVIVIIQGIGSGIVSTYSATLLHQFGYTPKQSALLNSPSGLLNITSAIICGSVARFYGNRWLITCVGTCFGVTAGALMSFAPTQGGKLTGIYMVNAMIGVTPIDYQWITSNTAGHTKRAFVTAFMNAAFAIGSIIGPQTFQARDAPKYQPAKISLIATYSSSILLTILVYIFYRFANHQRDKQAPAGGDDVTEAKAYAGLTDGQNLGFHYSY